MNKYGPDQQTRDAATAKSKVVRKEYGVVPVQLYHF